MDNKGKQTKKKAEAKKPGPEAPIINGVEGEAPAMANSIEIGDVKLFSSETDLNSLCGYAAWLLANKDVQNYLEVVTLKKKLRELPSYVSD